MKPSLHTVKVEAVNVQMVSAAHASALDVEEADARHVEVSAAPVVGAGSGRSRSAAGERERVDAAEVRPSLFKSTISAVAAVERAQPTMLSRATRRANNFKLGQRFFDEAHGRGSVVRLENDLVTVRFDTGGEEHMYNLASQRKLKPVIEDSHAYSPNDLFDLVDTDRCVANEPGLRSACRVIRRPPRARHRATRPTCSPLRAGCPCAVRGRSTRTSLPT